MIGPSPTKPSRLWKATLGAILLAGLLIVVGGTSTVTVVVLFALVGFVAVSVVFMMASGLWQAIREWRDPTEPAPVETPPPAESSAFGVTFASRTARRIAWTVCVLAGCAFLAAATVVVLDLVRTRPLHGVGLLLIPGIPILIVGQLWAVWILGTRLRPRAGGAWNPLSRRSRLSSRDFFGDLPAPARFGVIAVSTLLGISAFVAAPTEGGPAPPTRHCRYPLDNHGVVTCTDEATYYRVGRDVQRFAATVLAGFFVLHLAVSASALARRRREA